MNAGLRGSKVALILSVDLAYKSYENFGFCLLEESSGEVLDVKYLSYKAVGLGGFTQTEAFAQTTLDFCLRQGVSILMLDGPQGGLVKKCVNVRQWRAPLPA